MKLKWPIDAGENVVIGSSSASCTENVGYQFVQANGSLHQYLLEIQQHWISQSSMKIMDVEFELKDAQMGHCTEACLFVSLSSYHPFQNSMSDCCLEKILFRQ